MPKIYDRCAAKQKCNSPPVAPLLFFFLFHFPQEKTSLCLATREREGISYTRSPPPREKNIGAGRSKKNTHRMDTYAPRQAKAPGGCCPFQTYLSHADEQRKSNRLPFHRVIYACWCVVARNRPGRPLRLSPTSPPLHSPPLQLQARPARSTALVLWAFLSVPTLHHSITPSLCCMSPQTQHRDETPRKTRKLKKAKAMRQPDPFVALTPDPFWRPASGRGRREGPREQ